MLPPASGVTILGLVIAFAAPPAFAVLPGFIFGDLGLTGVVVVQALFAGLVPVILWIVRRGERLPLSSIGFHGVRVASIGWGLVLWAAISFGLPVLTDPLVARFGQEGMRAGLRELAVYPDWLLVLMGLTGGLVEETLYRGYSVERLTRWTGRWLAGVVVVVVFTIVHVPTWGWGFELAADLPFSMAMTAFYLWRRDLVANALAHSLALALVLPRTN